jgi:hypothetical protein
VPICQFHPSEADDMPSPSARPLVVSATPLLLALLSSALAAQATPGEVRGLVTDLGTGAPIASAQVALAPTGSRTLTAQDGTFRLLRVPAGDQMVEVHALGYAPRRVSVRVEPGAPGYVEVGLEMAPIPLDDVRVEAEERPRHPRLAPFWNRRSRGNGVFFTREEIERRGPSTLADLLRTVPNASIHWTDTGGSGSFLTFERSLRLSVGALPEVCAAAVIVDGVPMQLSLFGLDEIHPDAIEAIEVYSSGSRVPAEFARIGAPPPRRVDPQTSVQNRGAPVAPAGGHGGPPPTPMGTGWSPARTEVQGNPACGAVIIWTRMSVAPATPET